jgi:hypothetical protein
VFFQFVKLAPTSKIGGISCFDNRVHQPMSFMPKRENMKFSTPSCLPQRIFQQGQFQMSQAEATQQQLSRQPWSKIDEEK